MQAEKPKSASASGWAGSLANIMEGCIMRKGELRRQTILESAGRLFFENGYIPTSIEDILAALGCSKGSFYHHFPSKLAVLEALCHEHIKESFGRYQQERAEDPLYALNALLYYAHPLRNGGENILSMILMLRMREESSVVMSRLRLSLREVFFPELALLLATLNAAGRVHYTHPMLPELVWQSHIAFFDTVTACIIENAKNRPALAGQLRDIVYAERFLWERLLDAPFGSIRIVTLSEMLDVVSRVRDVKTAGEKLG
jgi:AcrR family transcriptional regulator